MLKNPYNSVDFGDALYDVGHLVAELTTNILIGYRGIFDGIMEQACGDGRGIQLHVGQDQRYFQGMDQVRFARSAGLPFMVLEGEFIGFADDFEVVLRTIGGDFGQ